LLLVKVTFDRWKGFCSSSLTSFWKEINIFYKLISGGASAAANNAQIEELSNQLMESKLTIEGLEKERDFYFSKLRDIEVLAQEYENDGGEFTQRALQVEYYKGLPLTFINKRPCPSKKNGNIIKYMAKCIL
jgi:hypothetical protein